MSEIETRIVQLAETCKESSTFLHRLEKLSVLSPDNKGDFFFQAGTILYKNSYFDLALKSWSSALRHFIRNGYNVGERASYANLGLAYDHLGDFRKAIQYHKKALEKAEEAGDEEGVSKCYINLGIAFSCLGDLNEGIEYNQKALRIKKEIGDTAGEAKCYANIGVAYRSLGDFRKAIEYHEKSLKMTKEMRDRTGESACYVNLGLVFSSLGDFKKAIEYHEKSLKIAKKTGDRTNESGCYINLSVAHHNLGQFRKAIEYLEKALRTKRRIGDKAGQAKCYANLGVASDNLGDSKKAIQYHRKSLKIVKEIEDKAGESVCYGNLGCSYRSLGDFLKAIKYHEKSLGIAEEIGDRAAVAKCYANLGVAYRNLGETNKAIEYHEKSLKIVKDIGDRTAEAACFRNLGVAYLSLGDRNKAIEYHKKSLRVDEETGDISSKRLNNLNLGRIYYDSNPELAYEYLKHSIELSEMIGGELLEEEHKIGFYARVSDAYQYIVPLCLTLKKETDAFDYVEKSKSRAFLDLLAFSEIKPTATLTNRLRSLLIDEQTCLDKLRNIQTRGFRRGITLMEPEEVERIFKDLDFIYDEIERCDPEYVFTRRGKTLSLGDIQRMVSRQKRNMVLLEYYVTKDKTYIFAVSSRDRKLHVITVPLSTERINHNLENYLREIAQYPSFGDEGSTWLGLGDYLIEPISEYIAEGDLIYFVPHASLHYLPLHALKMKDEPLITKHPVVYSPSASLIKFFQNKGSGRLHSCASFGAVFEEESEKVAKLFNSKPYNGCQATKENVLKNCSDRDILHFSCHGYFDNVDPLSSGVVLYDGRMLTAREVFGLELNAELVTLSACQTGLNQRSSGDELVGLTRAFLYAGSPSVVVSLWSVDARSAQELMLEFYRLLKSGTDKASALQGAQKKIMEKEEYSHPYYWAPFILVGDWE